MWAVTFPLVRFFIGIYAGQALGSQGCSGVCDSVDGTVMGMVVGVATELEELLPAEPVCAVVV